MLPKDTPYPFNDMPDENYFGEFRALSGSIGPHEKKDKEKINDTENDKFDDTINEFSVFPKD